MNEILISIASMAGLGISFAVILAIADRTMGVEEKKAIAEIEEILPGLNCGACGFAGCHSFAVALSKGEADVSGCLPGGEAASVKLSSLLGLEKRDRVKTTAVLRCNADYDHRKRYADYKGIYTCQAADKVFGGGLGCLYGCLGYGDCVGACPFGAITMANGLPVVNTAKCTSCGRCVKRCPKGLYTIEQFSDGSIVVVACGSLDKAAVVRQICGVGCIGCKVCEKLTAGVFEIKDNLARVDYGKANPDTEWDKAITKCPTKVIVKIT